MRIISGSHRGRNLILPKYFSDRPTTDYAKESIFNIIVNHFYFDEIRVLDVFAGSGSISFEFASRGCQDITTVDSNKKYIDFIRKTAATLDFPIQTIATDGFRFLKNSKTKFDLIFADPPYDLAEAETIPRLVFEGQLLKPEGWLILEHSEGISYSHFPFFREQRYYGKVNFSIFECPKKEEVVEPINDQL